MSMFDDFFVRATLAGIGVALAAAPLGCFVVWRRMAYFGDATAYASLLGVALALATDVPVFIGAIIAAIAMAATVALLSERRVPGDTLLGVLAHGALALGLMAASLVPGVRVDLSSYLFGDILAVGLTDLLVIWSGAALTLALLTWRWSRLLTVTLSPDLAQADGLSPPRESLGMILALACLVAVAIKVVGVLLIVALLLIPAAAARPFSRTPEHMAVLAAVIAVASAVVGLRLSLVLDTPPGPSIVCVSGAAFLIGRMIRRA